MIEFWDVVFVVGGRVRLFFVCYGGGLCFDLCIFVYIFILEKWEDLL